MVKGFGPDLGYVVVMSRQLPSLAREQRQIPNEPLYIHKPSRSLKGNAGKACKTS